MERLTIRAEHGIMVRSDVDFYIEPDDYDAIQKILARLAAYEDTGLTPDAVRDMAENAETSLLTWCENRYGFPVGKLMDLIEAEQEGRLIIRAPVTGHKCGSCANFIPGEGTGPGYCKMRKKLLKTDRDFRPYRSRRACTKDYVPKGETAPVSDSWIGKRFCEVV